RPRRKLTRRKREAPALRRPLPSLVVLTDTLRSEDARITGPSHGATAHPPSSHGGRTMKRLTTLALIVFALAAVPAALADDATPTAPSAPAAPQPRHVAPGTRLEILRLRMQIVQLRFRLHCSGGRNADKCQAFAQRV